MKIRKEVQMSLNLIRWSGLAAILGGVLWIAGAIQTGLKPRGCMGDECAFMPLRESGPIDTVLLLGITILRARVLPLWVAVLCVVGTLAMLGVNDQNAQVFLAIPFGIAWVVVGYV